MGQETGRGREEHRSDLALRYPPDDVSALPEVVVDREGWFRQHVARPGDDDNGCWWHTSLPEDPKKTPTGRFDLAHPDGTCYLAETEGVAVRELCGRFMTRGMPIPPEAIKGRVVSTLALPEEVTAANLTSPDAIGCGVTAEIHTVPDYFLTTAWAAAAHQAGFDALYYQARFTAGGEKALALFGPAQGHPERGVISSRPVAEVLAEMGYDLARSKVPSSAAVHSRVDDGADPEDA